MADDSPLPGLIPSGGSMSPGPPMPVPALPSGNPLAAIAPGQDPLGTIANSIQSTIGYATGDRALQQQAIDRQTRQDTFRAMIPASQALATINGHLANGDIDSANRVYQQFAHLAPIFPGLTAVGDKIAEQSFALKQRAAQADAIERQYPGEKGARAAAFLRGGGNVTLADMTNLEKAENENIIHQEVPGVGMVIGDRRDPGSFKVVQGTTEIPAPTFDPLEKKGMAALGVDETGASLSLRHQDPAVRQAVSAQRPIWLAKGIELSGDKPTAEQAQILSKIGFGQYASTPWSQIPQDVSKLYTQEFEAGLGRKENIRKDIDIAVARGAVANDPLWMHSPGLVGSKVSIGGKEAVPIEQTGITVGDARSPSAFGDKKFITAKEVPTYDALLSARDNVATIRSQIRQEIAAGNLGGLGAGMVAKLKTLTGQESPDQVLAAINPTLVGVGRAAMGGRVSQQEVTALQNAFQPRSIQTPAAMERALGNLQRIIDNNLARHEGRQPGDLTSQPVPYETKTINGVQYQRGADGQWRSR
jgi:hypothetical protein